MNGPDHRFDQSRTQPEIAAAAAGLSSDLRARFATYLLDELTIEHELYARQAVDRVLRTARDRGQLRRVEGDHGNDNAGGKV